MAITLLTRHAQRTRTAHAIGTASLAAKSGRAQMRRQPDEYFMGVASVGGSSGAVIDRIGLS
jgi:hypothetical protein